MQGSIDNSTNDKELTEALTLLNNVGIGFYVISGLMLLLSCLGSLIPLFFAYLNFFSQDSSGDEAGAPMFLFFFMIAVALILFLINLLFVATYYYTGRFLRERRRYTFCWIGSLAAAIHFFPIGTILGIVALTKMNTPGVKELFAQNDLRAAEKSDTSKV